MAFVFGIRTFFLWVIKFLIFQLHSECVYIAFQPSDRILLRRPFYCKDEQDLSTISYPKKRLEHYFQLNKIKVYFCCPYSHNTNSIVYKTTRKKKKQDVRIEQKQTHTWMKQRRKVWSGTMKTQRVHPQLS